ncbi:hypothetical protein B0H10DRAFT_2085533 [Mycena sp. CBHHK59/15]|nr:hypothetical protein B0H10DRAFT_2085533 [Mycena sp. CBHHK59/15]
MQLFIAPKKLFASSSMHFPSVLNRDESGCYGLLVSTDSRQVLSHIASGQPPSEIHLYAAAKYPTLEELESSTFGPPNILPLCNLQATARRDRRARVGAPKISRLVASWQWPHAFDSGDVEGGGARNRPRVPEGGAVGNTRQALFPPHHIL